MPVTLEIREEGRVLVFTISDPWELSDLIALGMRSRMHMDRASDTIHRVYDLRGTQQIPAGLSQAHSLINFKHIRAGEMVIVGTSAVASRFDSDKRFDNEDEAWDYLHKLMENPKGNR